MWPRFGLKIGNSTMCIAYARQDFKIEVIANKQGDRTSQACLIWDGDNEIECGLTAKQKMSLRPKQGVANILQFAQYEDDADLPLNKLLPHIPCHYDDVERAFVLKLQNADNDADKSKVCKLSWQAVLKKFLKAELELARQVYDATDGKPIVVLSVPTYYPSAAKNAISEIATDVGFQVAQIIEEPIAAILAYNLLDLTTIKTALTIKCGGLYSHFGIYELYGGFCTEISEFGPFDIGGENFTNALVEFICKEFQRKTKLDVHESKRSMAKLRVAATSCKHVLTTRPATQIYIDSLMDGFDFDMQMSRARFESIIQPVINKFMQTLTRHVESSQHIDHIVLLGATMQIPKLQAGINAIYPNAQLYATIPSDEVVSVGLAGHAGFMMLDDEIVIDEELPTEISIHEIDEPIYIWHDNNEKDAQLLVPKGTLLPHVAQVCVQISEEEPDSKLFHLQLGQHDPMQVHIPIAYSIVDNMILFQMEVKFNSPDDEFPTTTFSSPPDTSNQ